MSAADVARRNRWKVGTRLAGDEGRGETVIEITAIGEQMVLAKAISHAGEPVAWRESSWTFSCREWREVQPAYTPSGLDEFHPDTTHNPEGAK